MGVSQIHAYFFKNSFGDPFQNSTPHGLGDNKLRQCVLKNSKSQINSTVYS